MVFRSLGIKRPSVDPAIAGRIPPGQYLTERWPELHYGSVPSFDPVTWGLSVISGVENPLRLTWDEFQTLPMVTVHAGMHCVTRWSRLDNHWEGVSLRTVFGFGATSTDRAFHHVPL